MSALAITLIVIAVLATGGYIASLLRTITKLENSITRTKRNLGEWRKYARDLEAMRDSLEREILHLQADLTGYRIESGDLTAFTVYENGKKTHALSLPNMPAMPDTAKVEFAPMVIDPNTGKVKDNGGSITVTMPTIPRSVQLEQDLIKLAKFSNRLPDDPIYSDQRKAISEAKENEAKLLAEAKENEASKVESDNSKAIASDTGTQGSFSQVVLDDSALLKSDKYGELLDLLLVDLKVKKIPSAKYDYVKSKFLSWEKSKNPNTASEYAKRIINAKYGGK